MNRLPISYYYPASYSKSRNAEQQIFQSIVRYMRWTKSNSETSGKKSEKHRNNSLVFWECHWRRYTVTNRGGVQSLLILNANSTFCMFTSAAEKWTRHHAGSKRSVRVKNNVLPGSFNPAIFAGIFAIPSANVLWIQQERASLISANPVIFCLPSSNNRRIPIVGKPIWGE